MRPSKDPTMLLQPPAGLAFDDIEWDVSVLRVLLARMMMRTGMGAADVLRAWTRGTKSFAQVDKPAAACSASPSASPPASRFWSQDIDESAGAEPVAQQLATALRNSSARVLDLFRQWDENHDGKARALSFGTRRASFTPLLISLFSRLPYASLTLPYALCSSLAAYPPVLAPLLFPHPSFHPSPDLPSRVPQGNGRAGLQGQQRSNQPPLRRVG